jgi:hypothetical protein
LLNYLQVTWPHRVYAEGRVSTFTLVRFRELNRAAAAA